MNEKDIYEFTQDIDRLLSHGTHYVITTIDEKPYTISYLYEPDEKKIIQDINNVYKEFYGNNVTCIHAQYYLLDRKQFAQLHKNIIEQNNNKK